VNAVEIEGLGGPVEVLRDAVGVPHCYARSEHDAFLAQGFVHAQDRLWQMDYDRRRGLGRWAEIAGSRAVSADLFYRRAGLAAAVRRDVAALAPAARDMLAAYAAGVNAALRVIRLPREFRLTAAAPERWEPWHSLLVYRVRHMTMGSASYKLWRAVVAGALGRAAARLVATGVNEQVAIVPPGARYRASLPAGLGLDAAGSNNWVLAGSRTASGLPLLAGDPHRPLEVPGVYVQGHLACPEWDVLGLGMPGVPGFPHFGHNARVAWCITHGMGDDQDLYRYDGADPVTESRTEIIEVRGASPVRERAGLTGRGPLIADRLALAWTGATSDPNRGFDTFPVMLRAQTVPELFEAMRSWNEPVGNLLAADTDGTIGYLTRGRVPVRRRPEAAWVPVPGDDPSYGWDSWVPFEQMPRALNPDTGFLFSANNRILASDDGPYIGLDLAAPWRASRIAQVLPGLTTATVADMEALHRDVLSLPARRIAGLLPGWAPLAGWDGSMTPGSTAAAAYSVLRRELALLLLERSGLDAHVEDSWNRLLPGVRAESGMWRAAGEHLLTGERGLLGGWTWERALSEAVARAERAWHGEAWGELHATAQHHPLGRPELDPPSVPYGGDMDTVQASAYFPGGGLTTVSGSVARYAFDLADWDSSGWVVPLGADGEPGAEHFSNQQEHWRSGRLLPALYSRPAVQAAAQQQVTLVAASR
jgi:penicillin amidase